MAVPAHPRPWVRSPSDCDTAQERRLAETYTFMPLSGAAGESTTRSGCNCTNIYCCWCASHALRRLARDWRGAACDSPAVLPAVLEARSAAVEGDRPRRRRTDAGRTDGEGDAARRPRGATWSAWSAWSEWSAWSASHLSPSPASPAAARPRPGVPPPRRPRAGGQHASTAVSATRLRDRTSALAAAAAARAPIT